MNLVFNEVILHNFGSYGHAEVSLADKGFCLVSGRNKYALDNAYSNGSGKSFIWSAICFAISGETINGLSKNLKNINTDEPDAYVKLTFSVDKDTYELTRIIAPRSDLKVIRNGADISGKGIRESERVLAEALPDLDRDLISTMIILGQGMPNKFSSFSPVGRKELLEKLTKSDFMIEDVKNRVNGRKIDINNKSREFQDSHLVLSTQLTNTTASLNQAKSRLETIKNTDTHKAVVLADINLESAKLDLQAAEQADADVSAKLETARTQLTEAMTQKADLEKQLTENFTSATTADIAEKARLTAEVKACTAEIKKLSAITDICPTCRQRLIGVKKPDTTAKKLELAELEKQLKTITDSYAEKQRKFSDYQAGIDSQYNSSIAALKQSIADETATSKRTSADKQKASKLVNDLTIQLSLAKKDELEHDNQIKSLEAEITRLNAELTSLTNSAEMVSLGLTDQQAHLAVVNKIDTLIKRDFRGYLLTNIIKYMDAKAKAYGKLVFGTEDISIYLDGNALDISCNGKMFENLSGGEKQRVDVIIQFAIRSMLGAYLNVNSNIIVLDEITDFLDKQSCAAIMHLVETELNTTSSVFVISHMADYLELPIDSTIDVVKNENGISEIAA